MILMFIVCGLVALPFAGWLAAEWLMSTLAGWEMEPGLARYEHSPNQHLHTRELELGLAGHAMLCGRGE